MALTPEQLASSNTEDGHQKAFFCALVPLMHADKRLRWVHAIPNGGARDSITAGVLKATGVTAGVWDIFVPIASGCHHGLYIELKRPARRKEKRKGLSDSQWDFGLYAYGAGYATSVCFTWDEAIAALMAYLAKD